MDRVLMQTQRVWNKGVGECGTGPEQKADIHGYFSSALCVCFTGVPGALERAGLKQDEIKQATESQKGQF